MTENKTPKPWTQQEGENNNHYYFFLKYLEEEGKISIANFYKKLKKKVSQNIEFSYKLPTQNTFENWAYTEDWFKRKEAYVKFNLSRVGAELEELYLTKLVSKFALNDEIDLLILNEVKNILNDTNFKGNKAYAIEKLMKANSVTVENQRLIAGEPTEIIKSDNKNDNDNTLEIVLTTPKETDEDENRDGAES